MFYDVDPWEIYNLGWSRFRIYVTGLAAQEHSAWRLARSDEKVTPGPGASQEAIDASNAVRRAKDDADMEAQWAAVDAVIMGL